MLEWCFIAEGGRDIVWTLMGMTNRGMRRSSLSGREKAYLCDQRKS